jgi:hypothetical protein
MRSHVHLVPGPACTCSSFCMLHCFAAWCEPFSVHSSLHTPQRDSIIHASCMPATGVFDQADRMDALLIQENIWKMCSIIFCCGLEVHAKRIVTRCFCFIPLPKRAVVQSLPRCVVAFLCT